MADNDSSKLLRFDLVFNTETGQLSVAQEELQKTGAAAEEVGAAAQAGSQEATAAQEGLSEATEVQTAAIEEQAAAYEALKTAQLQAGEAAAEAGTKGDDGLKKIESRITRVALNIALMQLALSGFMAVAKDNEAFQGLQQVFENTFGDIFKDFGPQLDLISRGLQGIVQWIGAISAVAAPLISGIVDFVKMGVDEISGLIGAGVNLAQGNIRGALQTIKDSRKEAFAEFSGLGAQLSAGWDTAVKRFGEGVDTMTGKSTTFTKAMAAVHEAQLNAQTAHEDAMAKIKVDGLAREEQIQGTTDARKIDLIKQQAAKELEALRDGETRKEAVLADKKATGELKQHEYDAQLLTLHQSTADKALAITSQEVAKEDQVRRAHQQMLIGLFQKNSQVVADAAAQEAAAGGNLAQVLQASGAAEIKELGSQAAAKIELHAATAAAAAYSKAVEGAPVGPAAFLAGIAAAAPVFAWYTALAASVQIGANIASGAVGGNTGGGGGGSTGGGSSSSTATAAAPASGASADSAGSPGGGGTITVQLFLDRTVLLTMIRDASFDGDLLISANAIGSK